MNWLLSTIYGHTKVDIHATNMHTDFTEKSLFIMYTHRCWLYVKTKKTDITLQSEGEDIHFN